MRVDTLPSPGILSVAVELRRVAARAISSVEVTASATPGGKARGAQRLADFFTACATAAAAVADSVAPLSSGSASASNANKRRIIQVFSDAIDSRITYAPSQFVTNPARGVLAVTVNPADKTQVFIDLDADLPVGAVAYSYTPAAVGFLRDNLGNPVAAYSGKTVTNTIS